MNNAFLSLIISRKYTQGKGNRQRLLYVHVGMRYDLSGNGIRCEFFSFQRATLCTGWSSQSLSLLLHISFKILCFMVKNCWRVTMINKYTRQNLMRVSFGVYDVHHKSNNQVSFLYRRVRWICCSKNCTHADRLKIHSLVY